jgi:integrase
MNVEDVLRAIREKKPAAAVEGEAEALARLARMIRETFPLTVRALQILETEYNRPRKPRKRFSLTRVQSKKHGFTWYVRYYDPETKATVPSRWSTHTNDREKAEAFAIANREILLKGYREGEGGAPVMYKILGEYYQKDSEYLRNNEKLNRVIGEKTRRVCHNFVTKVFIPYLRKENVKAFYQVTAPLIARFQMSLVEKGNKPQSVRRYFRCLKSIFSYLVMTGAIPSHCFDDVIRIKGNKEEPRGCYDVARLNGVFSAPWEDSLSFLLCLLVYTTGMRNSEIERLRPKDIITIGPYTFLDIQTSKTRNGIRVVPLHPFVYERVQEYILKAAKGPEDYIFSAKGGPNQSTLYRKACLGMGARLGMKPEELDALRISFYSGRHFWKTMMSAGNLGGDAEEVFMGHKVSSDVSKRYNHRDKQGEALIVKTAGRIFSILDRVLFTPPGGNGNILAFPGNNSAEDAPDIPEQETGITYAR